MKTRVIGLLAAGTMLLSGCGVLTVGTRSGDGSPVGFGSPEPTATVPAGPQAPAGTTMETLDFTGCPFDVEVPIPEGWNIPSVSGDSYFIMKPGNEYPPDGQILVRCLPEEYDTAQGVADSTQRYRSSDEEYSIVNQRSGSHQGSSYWIYHAETTGDEILSIAGPANEYGLVMGVDLNGRAYEVDVNYKTIISDEALSETFAASVEATAIDGRSFDLPDQ